MTIKLKIEGMTCGHCVGAVEKALGAVSGVNGVLDVSLERGEALVEGDVAAEKLVAAVVDEGYQAKVA